MREAPDSFYLVSAGAWQRLDHDWLKKHMPEDGSVRLENLTNAIGVLVVAGPKSRALLGRVSEADFSSAAFPWLTGDEIVVGLAPATALRVNFVGELGWELHHPIEYQNHIFDALMDAGADLGLKPFGIRAMDSMRIEKSYRLIGTELSIEYAAYESGLDRFVHPNKGDFIGRDALVRWRERGFANTFVTLEVHDVTDADALGNNPIYQDGALVGRATGGNYGFRVGKSLALAMVRPEHAEPGTELEMTILGARHPVTVIPESPYDPDNSRLKS
jgi:dimethylglycine dehydrogenase